MDELFAFCAVLNAEVELSAKVVGQAGDFSDAGNIVVLLFSFVPLFRFSRVRVF